MGKCVEKGSIRFTKPKQYVLSVAGAKVGATAGWTVGAAADTALATVAASQSAATLVIPITAPLAVGDIITGFTVVGQIESAGNTATLDASLRKQTAAAADVVDALVGSMTQISTTADLIGNHALTGLTEVVATDSSYYLLLTATTAASTDIALLGVSITVKQ